MAPVQRHSGGALGFGENRGDTDGRRLVLLVCCRSGVWTTFRALIGA